MIACILYAGFVEQLMVGAGSSGAGALTALAVEASFKAVWGALPEGRRDGVTPAEALQEVSRLLWVVVS